NTLCEALRYQPRDTGLDTAALDAISEYWRCVREFYLPFESVTLPGTADLYNHEMPGGQYTNLYEQARALGLADRWSEVCRMYAEVNQLFGDIVKVTPTSKSVGDMALFMVANSLTSDDVVNSERDLAFPESVIDLLSGAMGQPPGGFPERVRQRIIGNRTSFSDRPGASLPDADFAEAAQKLESKMGHAPSQQDLLSQLLYPKVHDDFLAHTRAYSDTSGLPTPVFFYGTEPGEEFAVDIEAGKTLIVKYITVGGPHPDGTRTVFFELNGQPRDVNVTDKSLESSVLKNMKADPDDPTHVGARLPGMVVSVVVKEGASVRKGKPLLTIEAMKMQTTLQA
ncbi:MAG: biotin/lipoyl-containing protein, partial [Pirellulales bacterium]